jgi:hypothetical protein
MKPVMKINLNGPDGNIFAVVGKAIDIMEKAYSEKEIKDLKNRVFNSKSYDEALSVVGEYVKIKQVKDY